MKLWGITVTWKYRHPDTGAEEFRSNDLEIYAWSEEEALRQLDEGIAVWIGDIPEEYDLDIEEIEEGNW